MPGRIHLGASKTQIIICSEACKRIYRSVEQAEGVHRVNGLSYARRAMIISGVEPIINGT